MNILPLILMLILMLSVLTVEKLEKFKNQSIAQKQYQIFLQETERTVFNEHQETLFGIYKNNIKQLTIRYLVDQTARNANEKTAVQYRLLLIELMKVLYSETSFFKKLQQKRPDFLHDLVDLIQRAGDAASENLIKQVKDIARLNLNDPDIQGDPALQKAFYFMLKGTIHRVPLEEIDEEESINKEKAYVSLFEFINFNGKHEESNKNKKPEFPKIEIQLAPREILLAIFGDKNVVESILIRRNELAEQGDSGASAAFKEEFIGKKSLEGIEDDLLDFKITSTPKSEYN